MVFTLFIWYFSWAGSWGCSCVRTRTWFYWGSPKQTSARPYSILYSCSLGREIRSLESLKLIFMLNYSSWVLDTRHSLIMLLTLMPLGSRGRNASRSAITHYICKRLTQKKVADGFVAISGKDAERTPSALSYFFCLPFCNLSVRRLGGWGSSSPSPVKERQGRGARWAGGALGCPLTRHPNHRTLQERGSLSFPWKKIKKK